MDKAEILIHYDWNINWYKILESNLKLSSNTKDV